MRISRFYLPGDYSHDRLELPKEQCHYALTVLRLKNGFVVEIFNGEGDCARGTIEVHGRHQADILITERLDTDSESPLDSTLVQCISKGDRMDYSIQKCVELGISRIQPVFSERCEVKLDGDKLQKRREQWQQIVINACEQSGRNLVPQVMPTCTLQDYLQSFNPTKCLGIIGDPYAQQDLKQLPNPKNGISLLIGPEGGLSEDEVALAVNSGFQAVCLGPRVLRTETAGPALLAISQSLWGDL
ncbi:MULTISPECIES: 16S rRNA (uracil(1498)-N(3))-methyltransferase [Thiomicrorhabdus]|uniref:Ribosomal RNA small subunit methyltransferase E n=1 Tax=Thiomicrorhabdus heinhorstiae TaxID=2748010 RepID=A0ABS0BVG8_9GAMM|nr:MULTISPECIES: 16S rRNA (uracil(1498)-N(3))-methyltransferase [Thiomicrorhabdus]MBF6057817.1 16S rRNA (uracil(1498)-N(3))-methyltransferase [Thiomicrorhabdus heinhorstiae]